ncbi:MAG: TIR domain-containing protein [Ruminiclostridium sp.]|nr:TIR domain-containing protein [Ruminiclostridium sp.]
MADIFISHSSKDSKTAMMLCEYLEDNGLTCWISSRDIAAGSDWAASISTAINAAKAFLLIYSKNSSQSEQVARELGIVETKGHIAVIPYRADETPLTGSFEYFLTSAHWIVADVKNKEYKLDDLFRDITNVQGITVRPKKKPPEEPPVTVTETKPDTAGKKPGLSKKAVAAVCGATAAGLICVGTAVFFLINGSSSEPEPVQTTTSTTAASTTAPPETTTTPDDTDDAKKKMTKTDTVTDKEVSINYSGRICRGTYTGEVDSRGIPHGQGEFNGEYNNDDGGYGKVYYKGGFDNGNCSDKMAYAEQYLSDGMKCVLRCAYENGMENGYGECVWTFPDKEDKITYRGNWKNSKYNGSGVLTTIFENGTVSKYVGNFKDGLCEGQVKHTISYPEGGVKLDYSYEGDWSAGSKEGQGSEKTVFSDGKTDSYEGGFSAGKREGHGKNTTTYSNGTVTVTEGEFSDGSPVDGTPFTNYSADGSVLKTGTWKNGKMYSD